MKKYILMPLLILSLTFSISACGKTDTTTSEASITNEESTTKETNDSNEDVNESSKSIDVTSENTEDNVVSNKKAYELKDEMINAEASKMLFQVDDLILTVDGTMTFHDVITAFESNDEEYIFKSTFQASSDVIYKTSDDYKDKIATVESTMTDFGHAPLLDISKISADGSEVPYVHLTFDNMTGNAAEFSECTLVAINFPRRTERADTPTDYNLWLPGGIDYEDASIFTMDNAPEIFTKAGYIEVDDASNIPEGVNAIFLKAPNSDMYIFGVINNEGLISQSRLDFSSAATDVGLEVPVIY